MLKVVLGGVLVTRGSRSVGDRVNAYVDGDNEFRSVENLVPSSPTCNYNSLDSACCQRLRLHCFHSLLLALVIVLLFGDHTF